jgi:hypothetical protein
LKGIIWIDAHLKIYIQMKINDVLTIYDKFYPKKESENWLRILNVSWPAVSKIF